MRWICAIAALIVTLVVLRAEGPDDRYVAVYKSIQEGDNLAASAQSDLARNKYLAAEEELKKLQESYPNWNAKAVQFR